MKGLGNPFVNLPVQCVPREKGRCTRTASCLLVIYELFTIFRSAVPLTRTMRSDEKIRPSRACPSKYRVQRRSEVDVGQNLHVTYYVIDSAIDYYR